MRRFLRAAACLIPAALFAVPTDAADEAPKSAPSPLKFKKTVVDNKFRSEGVAVADVNKDGKNDLLVGDYWYEAPDWKRREVRKPGDWGDGLKSYSECMICFADDVNGDGWVDQISIGFPGKPCFWYENPKGSYDQHWKEHVAWRSACNETPLYTDLLGTGKRVLVMGWQPKGQMAYFTPGKDPYAPWDMHPISDPSVPPEMKDGKPVPNTGKQTPGTQQFSHGLGVGDVNGDGRKDVMVAQGWWEQPEKVSDAPWKFHPAALGEACADMYAYDLDGDNKADVVSSSAHKFGIWSYLQKPGKGDHPAFVKQDLFPKLVSETHAMHCVDLNGDGQKDLVTGKRWWSHGRSEPGSDWPARVYWFEAKKRDGVVTFTPYVIDEDSGIGTQFEVTDFNKDGKLDIVTSNKKGVFLLIQEK